MEYKIPVSSREYYKAILMVLNFNLKLTNLEIEILATLLYRNKIVINTEARDIIRAVLNKDKFNTNNYIHKLKRKGIFLKQNDSTLYINPGIIEATKDSKISFEFILNDNPN